MVFLARGFHKASSKSCHLKLTSLWINKRVSCMVSIHALRMRMSCFLLSWQWVRNYHNKGKWNRRNSNRRVCHFVWPFSSPFWNLQRKAKEIDQIKIKESTILFDLSAHLFGIYKRQKKQIKLRSKSPPFCLPFFQFTFFTFVPTGQRCMLSTGVFTAYSKVCNVRGMRLPPAATKSEAVLMTLTKWHIAKHRVA